MNELQVLEQEKSVLRWGGLAGMLGGILFILAFVVAIAGPVGMEDPATLEGWVTRFPDIIAARVVENVLYLLGLILGVPLFLALYRALRRTSLAPALFGSVLGIVGLVPMMAASIPHAAHSKLSDLYHAPGATAADQAALALLWQAIWGVIDMMTYVGFFIVPIGLILLGVGMLGSPAFGKGYGWVSVALGMVGLAAAFFQIIDPASMAGAISYFAIIIFYFILGWKVWSLSKAPLAVQEPGD
jgi:hypothetical protein